MVMAPEIREWRHYDRMLGPAGRMALDAARLVPGQRVLDVGSGAGGSALEAGHRVGKDGSVVGVEDDPAAVHVATLRAREQLLSWVRFAALDLARAELPQAAFDAVVSRFGTGRLHDPLRTFSRLAGALAPGGRLAFVALREGARCEWLDLPRRVVAEVLGAEPARSVGAGTEHALTPIGSERARALLERAGFSAVELTPIEQPWWVGDDVDDAVEFFFETQGRALDASAEDFARLTRALGRALRPHARADGVWLPAAAWLVTARSPGLAPAGRGEGN